VDTVLERSLHSKHFALSTFFHFQLVFEKNAFKTKIDFLGGCWQENGGLWAVSSGKRLQFVYRWTRKHK
jgi:hypothetical protein